MNNDNLRELGLGKDSGLTNIEVDRLIAFKRRIASLTVADIDHLAQTYLDHLNDKSDAERIKGYRIWESVWALELRDPAQAIWYEIYSMMTRPPLWPEAQNMQSAMHVIHGAFQAVFYQDRISKETFDFLRQEWTKALEE